jgi:hypothetical protein
VTSFGAREGRADDEQAGWENQTGIDGGFDPAGLQSRCRSGLDDDLLAVLQMPCPVTHQSRQRNTGVGSERYEAHGRLRVPEMVTEGHQIQLATAEGRVLQDCPS